MDKFQTRYLAHQKRKKQTLIEIMKLRHSDRMFSESIFDTKLIDEIIDSTNYCPTSCDRHGISLKVITNKDQKNLLGGLLVGGVGWIHRASVIILIFAHREAYKSGDEINFMPYLDAGVVVQQLYLTSANKGLACCFCNPNIRDFNKEHFNKIFGSDIFCGAFAVGNKYEKTRSSTDSIPGK